MLGTDLAVAQTPGVPFGCCLDSWTIPPLAVDVERQSISVTPETSNFGLMARDVRAVGEQSASVLYYSVVGGVRDEALRRLVTGVRFVVSDAFVSVLWTVF